MGKYRKRYFSVKREDYERAHDILSKFYDRGDLDSITVEFGTKHDLVLVGVECTSDDYMSLMKELGIEFV